MRTFYLQLTVVSGIAWFTSNSSAQTWQTVDDFLWDAGSSVQAMGRDPLGSIYAAGFNFTGQAGIRKSSDAGASWATIGVIQSTSLATYSAITSDPAGNLYAAGKHDSLWFVTRSSDSGATWAEVDFLAGLTNWAPWHVASDAAGNVYVAGAGASAWVVRKGLSGISWSTTDTFNPGGGGRALSVLSHPSGVFVAGTGSVTVKNNTTSYWLVRRSQDGGNTWQTVDSFAGGEPGRGGIGSDAVGNIYVVGANNGHWIVRKSADGGATWATIDDVQNCVTTVTSTKPYRTQTTCYSARATGVAVDSAGNLFVCGTTDSATGTHWIVRNSAAGIGPWQTVDDFQRVAGEGAYPYAVVADDFGNVFVGGHGGSHWIARKLSAP